MGLELHSSSILRTELSKEYLSRITYLTSDSRIDFQTNLEESLKNIYDLEKKFNFLVSEKNKIISTIESNKWPHSIEEWSLGINQLIGTKLSELDLSTFEMSNQENIDLFLSIIEKGNELIDDVKRCSKKITNSKKDKLDDIIHQIGIKSKLNVLFWDDFDNRFNYSSLNRSDESNLRLIYTLGKDFYKNLNTKLFLVLNKNIDSESENSVIEALEVVIQSFITKEQDIINITTRIKEWYDENVEDITYKLLLRKIMDGDKSMNKNVPFALITNLRIVNSKIVEHSIEGQDHFYSKYTRKPDVANLALVTDDIEKLRIRLIDCFNILEGDFIRESNSEIFVSLFEKDRFIAPVEWLGTNKELNHFIFGIADDLRESRNFWPLVNNCFVRNGKKLGKDSVRSHKTPKPISENSLLILDNAIKSLIY